MLLACANVVKVNTEISLDAVVSDPVFAFMNRSGILRPDKARQDKTGEG